MEQHRKPQNPTLAVLIAALALAVMALYGLTHLQPVPDVAPHSGDHTPAAALPARVLHLPPA